MNNSGIASSLENLNSELPENVTLVAVSKTKPDSDILTAYEEGQRDFGENKVQEITRKSETLPKDIKWHFIGHLQRNKVKYISPFVYLIHSVDSLKLLKEIEKRAGNSQRTIHCLLQMSIAEEETKFGLNTSELKILLESDDYLNMLHVKVVGLMGMATNTHNEAKIRTEFQFLKNIFDLTKDNHFASDDSFCFLSMGMTSDYNIAIEEGSNMIRVGSMIFGERSKH